FTVPIPRRRSGNSFFAAFLRALKFFRACRPRLVNSTTRTPDAYRDSITPVQVASSGWKYRGRTPCRTMASMILSFLRLSLDSIANGLHLLPGGIADFKKLSKGSGRGKQDDVLFR